MTNRASLITSTGATVFVNGQIYSVGTDHANFKSICAAISEDNLEAVPDLCDLRSAVRKWMRSAFSGDFRLNGDLLSYKGYTFGTRLTEKALAMIDAGNNAKPLLNFLAKVCNNPSHAAREELLLFCDANGFMITSTGNIVAYKAVKDNYMDIHSGTVRYKVGDTPSMDRGAVDDNRNNLCSRGLHFAALEYAQMFGGGRGHMMAVEVDPADVVSIPADYRNQKGRAWKLTVVAELAGELPKQEVYDYNPDTDSWGDFNDEGFDLDDSDLDNELGFFDVVDDDGNDLYDLGHRDGKRRRVRSYERGVNEAYDDGYTDGRNGN